MYTPKLQYVEFRSDDLDLIEMDPTLNLRNNWSLEQNDL